MNATREEVHRLVDSLPNEGLDELRELILELMREPVDLTDEELEEMEKGKEELRRGEWAWWEDIRRKDA